MDLEVGHYLAISGHVLLDHVAMNFRAQVRGGGRDQTFDVELIRISQQPNHRHRIVRLVADVGEHDQPRLVGNGVGRCACARGLGSAANIKSNAAMMATIRMFSSGALPLYQLPNTKSHHTSSDLPSEVRGR